VNPFGTVPCIYYNGKAVFESAITVEWIDEQFPSDVNLLPRDPAARASVRLLVARFGDKVAGPLMKWIRNSDPQEEDSLKAEAITQLKGLNDLYVSQGARNGPYFLGDTFSYAEIAIVPFLYRYLPYLRQAKHVDLFNPEHRLDRIQQAFEACQDRPAFKRTAPAIDLFMKVYAGYASPAPVKSSFFGTHRHTILTSIITAVAAAGATALVLSRMNPR